MLNDFSNHEIEGVVRRALAGDRRAARALFVAIERDHGAHRISTIATLARIDEPALWTSLLAFLAGGGWQGIPIPPPSYAVARDLQRVFVEPFGQPLLGRHRVVCEGLNSPSARIRALAATLAVKQHNEGAAPYLVALLSDIHPDVRIAASHALQAMPDPESIEPLTNNMFAPDLGVRAAAADALRAIGPAALPAVLRHLIQDRLTPAFRQAAVRALPYLAAGADPADVNDLIESLRGTAAGAAVPVKADHLLQWCRSSSANARSLDAIAG